MTSGPVHDLGFVLAKCAEALARPSTILLALSCLGALLLVRGATRRVGAVLLAASLGTEALLAAVPFDAFALAPLEDAFAELPRPAPTADGIIVLGGAVDPVLTEAHGMPSLDSHAERMTEFVRLARNAPRGEVLAFTGGSGRVVNGRLSEADVARMLFDGLGLGGRAIVYEGASRTTWENAAALARLLRPRPGQRWILVTSASHMPRAVAAFRAHGFGVLPDPVAYKTGPSWLARSGPDWAGRLARLDLAAHEWEGLAVYRLLGRTRHLLHAPSVGGELTPRGVSDTPSRFPDGGVAQR